MTSNKRVGIVGSGNWGSCIAKIVGNNLANLPNFENEVLMWVFEETVDGRKLTEIINEDHENVKYLPGVKLPPNVVACPDLIKTVENADVLVFVLPHQFMGRVMQQMKGKLKTNAYGVSLIKGLMEDERGGIRLITDSIRDALNIPCAALMGANLAQEVARENFCEATIGCKNKDHGEELKALFETDYFRIVVTDDEVGVELCGALKNVVAVGAGFSEGLGYGDNTKAAIIRLGFMEMKKFIFDFFGDRGISENTFLESCGLADLVTTCYGGRNRKVAIEHAKTGKPISQLEQELLGGQSAQGPLTAREVNITLKAVNREEDFPLMTAVHKICQGEMKAADFIDCVRNHPIHA
jgi:glycerol-3-phosphate dehydrogenase (NAD+)